MRCNSSTSLFDLCRGARAGIALCVGLAACGEVDSTLEVAAYPSRPQSLHPMGSAADAVVFQPTMRASSVLQTNAGGFALPPERSTWWWGEPFFGSPVAASADHLFVADRLNRRVLGFTTAGLLNGSNADLVLNQSDFYDIHHRGVPWEQWFQPESVAVDADGTVYVSDRTDVWVYEDPYTTDGIADYKLAGLPTIPFPPLTITSLRTLPSGLLAVVVESTILFYRPGSAEPAAQYDLLNPCNNSPNNPYPYFPRTWFFEIAEVEGSLLVGCAYYDPGPGWTHYEAWAFAPDPNTGYVVDTPVLAFDFGAVIFQPKSGFAIGGDETNGWHLFVSEARSHRVLKFKNVDDHLTALYGSTPPAPLSQANADHVYGQPDLASLACNQSAEASDETLCKPSGVTVQGGTLWIPDTDNNRVLRFNDAVSIDADAASTTVGQSGWSFNLANRLDANSILSGTGLAVNPSTHKTYVVDQSSNRVLVFNDFDGFGIGEGGAPHTVIGQTDPEAYQANQGNTLPDVNSLWSPTDVAVDSNTGIAWVSDQGNQRILGYVDAGAEADRLVGAADYADVPTTDCYFGALAVHDGDLFVAVASALGGQANRIFYYDVDAAGPFPAKPDRVFGQTEADPLPDPYTCAGGAPNGCNRNVMNSPRPDSLCNVTGLALDSSGDLWVADSYNNRVLRFAAPTADGSAATAADSVVGQTDLIRRNSYGGLSGPNRYGFRDTNSIRDIAISNGHTLWVADVAADRIIGFSDPLVADPATGMPAADTVIGTYRFNQSGGNSPPTAATLRDPNALAVDSTGRTLLILDNGNHRMVRHVANSPPIIRVVGGNFISVVTDATAVVELEVHDPDDDSTDTIVLATNAGGAASINGTTVTYSAAGVLPGTLTKIRAIVSEEGGHGLTGETVIVFHVVAKPATEWEPGRPPAAREPLEPEIGCKCSGAATGGLALPWLGTLLVGARRRRSRSKA